MSSKLDSLLGGQEEKSHGKTTIETVRTDTLSEVQLSAYAYDKAFTYARLACEINASTIECGGYLVSPKGTPGRAAQDAYLAHGQVVGSGDFRLSAEDVIAAGRYLAERNLKILGWWHSHGSLNTFHSGIDVNNQMTVLNAISPFNYVTQDKLMSLEGLTSVIEGNSLVSFDPTNPGTRFEMPLNELSSASLSRIRMRVRQQVGFAYSFVVNDQGKSSYPYAELATRVFNPTDDSYVDKSAHVDVHVFPSLQQGVNEDQLEEEILERVKVRRTVLYSISSTIDSLLKGTPITEAQGLKRKRVPKKSNYSTKQVIIPIGEQNTTQQPVSPTSYLGNSTSIPSGLSSIVNIPKSRAPSMLEQFALDPNDKRPIVIKKKEALAYNVPPSWSSWNYPTSKVYGESGSQGKPWYEPLINHSKGGPIIGVND